MKNVQLDGIKVGAGKPVRIAGVINVSPESFFKGSVATRKTGLVRKAARMEEEGADFLDVGALSTAPYLETAISEEEECRRLKKALQLIRKRVRIPISVDTSRSLPAQAALDWGATILNDVTGLKGDPNMGRVAKKARGVILMAHPIGTKESSLKNPIQDTLRILKRALQLARRAGISPSKIVLDPGIGFFRKTRLPWWKWDLTLIKHLEKLTRLGHPLFVGVSRKSFIGHLLGGVPPEKRLAGSLAATCIAIQNGASIIRTHDVAETKALMAYGIMS